MSKKASFKNSTGLFLISLTAVMAFRWIGFEPFVIPSGSMIPTLLINDHILVNKSAFGVRVPFTSTWLTKPQLPNRGDIVVFKSVEKDDYFMIKRVVGLPGDRVKFDEDGRLFINGEEMKRDVVSEIPKEWSDDDLGEGRSQVLISLEQLGEHSHYTMLEKEAYRNTVDGRVVPEGQLFVMGDNRDRSRDSRYWGELPLENLLGKALFVWLSCSKTLISANFVCDPRHIRWQRFFHRLE